MKMWIKISTVLLLCTILVSHTESHNILAIFNIPSKSLHLAAVSMVKILAGRGHNVTLVTQYPYDNTDKNIKHVYLKDTAEVNERNMANFFEFERSPYLIFYDLESIGIQNCRLTLQDSAFKQLLRSDTKFDLLLIDPFLSSSLLYLSKYYDVPVLFYSAFDSGFPTNHLLGNPSSPSHVPNIFFKVSGEMTFLQRLENTLLYLLNESIRNYYSIPSHDRLVKEFFPNAPHISEYLYKSSVILLNGDISIMDAMPRTPGMVHIGGYHIEKPKPLPEDLEKIINNAQNGVILFSLGSNVKSSQMPKSRIQSILQIFARLNVTIIWKWENEDLPDKPSNVFIKKWLPQNDILAHRNVKLFITHGGQHSILETVYHGIPCVSISIFMDQGANSFRAVNHGYAEWIPYKEFTPKRFEDAINKTLSDPRYTKMAKRRSRIMRDKLVDPQEQVAFWVEYVVRHGGTEHFQVAALKLNWYQYLLLDVVVFILFCLVFIALLLKFLLEFVLRKTIKRKRD